MSGIEEARSVVAPAADASYPDVWNPFLFGPDKLDHCVVLVLQMLIDSWPACSPPEGLAVTTPYWWTGDLHENTVASIASSQENDYETAWRESGSLGKWNRLEIGIPKTPQQLALELLTLARGGCCADRKAGAAVRRPERWHLNGRDRFGVSGHGVSDTSPAQ